MLDIRQLILREMKELLNEANNYPSKIELSDITRKLRIEMYIKKGDSWDTAVLDKKNKTYSYLYNIIPNGIVLVSFWASYCQPCLKEKPFFNSILPKRNIQLISVWTDGYDNVSPSIRIPVVAIKKGYVSQNESKVYVVDSIQHELTQNPINSVPLNILFRNKQPVAYVSSFTSESDLEQFLNKHLPEQNPPQKPAAPAQPAPAAPAPAAPASQFKAGQRVIFIRTNRVFVVVSVNQDGTVNIKAPTSEKVFNNIDPKKLKIL